MWYGGKAFETNPLTKFLFYFSVLYQVKFTEADRCFKSSNMKSFMENSR